MFLGGVQGRQARGELTTEAHGENEEERIETTEYPENTEPVRERIKRELTEEIEKGNGRERTRKNTKG